MAFIQADKPKLDLTFRLSRFQATLVANLRGLSKGTTMTLKTSYQQHSHLKQVITLLSLCLFIGGMALLLRGESSLAAAPPSAAASIVATLDNVGHHSTHYNKASTSLKLNSSGFAVISYLDLTNDGELKVAICNDAACSNPTVRTVDSNVGVGGYSSLALNNSGFPVISYYDYENGDLKVAICHDATCTNTPTLTTVDSTDDVGQDTSLELSSNGFPVISYYDVTNKDLKVAVCHNATCTNTPTLAPVDSVGNVGAHTSLTLNDSGFPVISYLDFNNPSNVGLKVAVCNNSACTTSTKTPVDSANAGRYSSLQLNDSGNPVISYYDSGNENLKLAVCNDAVCTVRTLKTVDDTPKTGVRTALALSSNGNPIISHHGFGTAGFDLRVAVCNDATCTTPTLTTINNESSTFISLALNNKEIPVISFKGNSSTLKVAVCNICMTPLLTTVDSDGSVGAHTSLALTNSGNAIISYKDTTNSDLNVAVCDDSACTNPDLLTVNNNINVGNTSLVLTNNGLPVISYYDDTNDDLELAICNNIACDNPTLKTVDSSGNMGKYQSLVLNNSDLAVISYYDETDFDLKVAVCNDAICSNPTINVVDGAGAFFLGEYSSLALNSNGFPVISYYDGTAGNLNLKLAVCHDAVCSSATKNPIDSNNMVGKHTSLALNSLGFPVVSYYDYGNDDLKIAVCNDANCTLPTITVVDSIGDVGEFNSLTLTHDDFPVISYFDETNDDLKVAICNDITCTTPALVTVDSNGSPGQYSSVALASNGFPVMSYFDGSPNSDLKTAVFNMSSGSEIYLPMIVR